MGTQLLVGRLGGHSRHQPASGANAAQDATSVTAASPARQSLDRGADGAQVLEAGGPVRSAANTVEHGLLGGRAVRHLVAVVRWRPYPLGESSQAVSAGDGLLAADVGQAPQA